MIIKNMENISFEYGHILKKWFSIIVLFVLSCFVVGCVSPSAFKKSEISKDESKSIFVLMDGTGNNEQVPTNVYRLYDGITKKNDNKTAWIYIEGVGNASDPIGSISGQAAGFGLEANVLQGYRFLINQYKLGDRIYIFGFSRGAHSARSLAGLISYAGIPKIKPGQDESIFDKLSVNSGYVFGNKILEKTKKELDIKHVNDWKTWDASKPPIMTKILKTEIDKIKDNNIEIQPAEIEFLGVWDTVPGSQGIDYFDDGKNYLVCKQDKDSTDDKERYKIDSYPPIHHIAHAVSMDENRKEFSPLFLCSKEINKDSVHNPERTKLDEVAFPGVHADVGGGYGHQNHQLPDVSLKWMIEQLKPHYDSPEFYEYINGKINPDPEGLGDLSVSKLIKGDIHFPCLDRKLPNNIVYHESVKMRKASGLVPWLYYDVKPKVGSSSQACKNKIKPSDWKADPTDGSKEGNVVCIEQSKITCDALGYPTK